MIANLEYALCKESLMDDEFNIQLLKAESILQYSLFVLRSSSKRYVFLAPNLETEIQMQTDFQIFGYFLFLCVYFRLFVKLRVDFHSSLYTASHVRAYVPPYCTTLVVLCGGWLKNQSNRPLPTNNGIPQCLSMPQQYVCNYQSRFKECTLV